MRRDIGDIYDLVAEAIGKNAKHVARDIRMKLGTLYDSIDPDREPEIPHRRVVDIAESCEKHGASRKTANEPIHWACRERAILSFDMPEVEAAPDEIRSAFIRAAKEMGDVASALEESLDPKSPGGKKLTKREYLNNEREIMEAIQALLAHRELLRQTVEE
jgi:hypothetical protein